MQHSKYASIHSMLIVALFSLLSVSCVTEEVASNSAKGNFEALWHTMDQRYCFFDYKQEAYGLDWNEVYHRYAPAFAHDMTDRQLLEALGNMLAELRDGHVNLYAAHDVARYGRWFDDYPMNFSDSLERRYLGRTEDYSIASGLKYRMLDDHIAYVRCESFASGFGDGNLHEMMRSLAVCDGLIVDVRNNGGGMLTAAEKLASLFVDEATIGGYITHKTGPGHQAFSTPQTIVLKPFVGLRWQKPVVVLTNRRTYSAANSFVMFLKGLENVTIIGDKTGGGSGLPFTSELPNGWTVRFSACPMLNRNKQHTEMGIDPDVKVDIDPHDLQNGIDTIIEKARRLLKSTDKL